MAQCPLRTMRPGALLLAAAIACGSAARADDGALSAREHANLAALAQVAGAVRHFHPSDEAADADWNDRLVRLVRFVLDAPDDAALASRLADAFAPVAPTVAIGAGAAPPTRAAAGEPPDGATCRVAWVHHGFGRTAIPGGIYRSRRERTPLDREPAAASRDPWTWTNGAIAVRVPLVVFGDATRTLPVASADDPLRAVDGDRGATDRATRLASVIACWNVFRHFDPYLDLATDDWTTALAPALDDAAAASDGDGLAFALQRLGAKAKDGHVSAFVFGAGGELLAPVGLAWAGDDLVVTVPPPGSALVRGDRITSIDGVPTAEAAARRAERLGAASPQFKRAQLTRTILAGPPGTAVVLGATSPDGRERAVRVMRAPGLPPAEPRPGAIVELEPGIWYVDIDQLTLASFNAALPDLAQASGIVFDFRGYPGKLEDPTVFFGHVLGRFAQSPIWEIPIFRRPAQQAREIDPNTGRWAIFPRDPVLKARKAFLVDGRAISYAESCMSIVEHERAGAIVGEATAGTNGNVAAADLPGRARVIFTGMIVRKHDGSRFHGIGVLPTIPVTRTVEGIAAGRDEILEAGVKAVKKEE